MSSLTWDEITGLHIERSYFNMSQKMMTTMKSGILYPIYTMLVMPNDIISISNEVVVRQKPTIAPSFSDYTIKFVDVFVSLRSLDKNIYNFMSGTKEYTPYKQWEEPLPKWKPTKSEVENGVVNIRAGSLWDYLENPINCIIVDDEDAQIDYLRQGYGYIKDILFRNEAREESILIDGEPNSWKGQNLLRVNYDRDYFTTSLPSQQLGNPSGIPIANFTTGLDFTDVFNNIKTLSIGNNPTTINGWEGITNVNKGLVGFQSPTNSNGNINDVKETLITNFNKVKSEGISSALILISQFKEALALQSFSEINAFCGIRTDEFLRAHYGIAPTDENLLYPEVLNRSKVSLLTSIVSQTSESQNTPLGTMAGEGLAVGSSGTTIYHAKEYGIYYKLCYIKASTIYGNQHINREFTQNSKFDFPLPLLQRLSAQPLYRKELVYKSKYRPLDEKLMLEVDGDGKVDYTNWEKSIEGENFNFEDTEDMDARTNNNRVIGFQDIYACYKEKRDRIAGGFSLEQAYRVNKVASIEATNNANPNASKESDMIYVADKEKSLYKKYNQYNWTQARFFSIKDDELPLINDDFLEYKEDKRNYPELKSDDYETSTDEFYIWHNNIVDSWRNITRVQLPTTLGLMG